MKTPRLALVHDRLAVFRGGERVFRSICEAFPEADAFALLADADTLGPDGVALVQRLTSTSFLRLVPYRGHVYRQLLPLYPLAARSLPLRTYDVVISSSSAFAHWVAPSRRSLHMCYLYTPLRQAWSEEQATSRRLPPSLRRLYTVASAGFRKVDRRVATRVHSFATTSRFVRERIRNAYGREATVIPPGISLDRFRITSNVADYFLVVSALVPYKHIEIAIDACNRLGAPLRIVGAGPELARLRSIAGNTVQFLGTPSDDEVAQLYASCRALLFPTIDDFGITCIEAQASGRPVIAVGAGGALDTIIPNRTGLFFQEQTVDALCEAIAKFNAIRFDTREIRKNAERYSEAEFKNQLRDWVGREMDARRSDFTGVGSP